MTACLPHKRFDGNLPEVITSKLLPRQLFKFDLVAEKKNPPNRLGVDLI